jgi:hypothetical protein
MHESQSPKLYIWEYIFVKSHQLTLVLLQIELLCADWKNSLIQCSYYPWHPLTNFNLYLLCVKRSRLLPNLSDDIVQRSRDRVDRSNRYVDTWYVHINMETGPDTSYGRVSGHATNERAHTKEKQPHAIESSRANRYFT